MAINISGNGVVSLISNFVYISTGGLSTVSNISVSVSNFGRPICFKFNIGDKAWIRPGSKPVFVEHDKCVCKGKEPPLPFPKEVKTIAGIHFNGINTFYILNDGQVFREASLLTGGEFLNIEKQRLKTLQAEAMLNLDRLRNRTANCL